MIWRRMDIFTQYMRVYGLSFPQAVQRVAELYGVE